MGENSKIEWTDHTFNPWVGCTKLTRACDNCYAENWAKRTGHPELWHKERRRTSAANWRQPYRWNEAAKLSGRRARVFCASLADVFDNQVPWEWRTHLFDLICETQHLDWQLLTKRPENIAKMLPADWGDGYPNVWLGTTVEDQKRADHRVPLLLSVPAKVRFLSCEPLLGPLALDDVCDGWKFMDFLRGNWWHDCDPPNIERGHPKIDWVIAGGESGPKARPSHPDWFRSLRDQCAAAGVPFLFKQWGEWCDTHPDWPRAHGHVIANDGTLYQSSDLAYPDGPRRGEALRAEHDKAHLTAIYRVGKKAAGRLLDGVEHNGFPG